MVETAERAKLEKLPKGVYLGLCSSLESNPRSSSAASRPFGSTPNGANPAFFTIAFFEVPPEKSERYDQPHAARPAEERVSAALAVTERDSRPPDLLDVCNASRRVSALKARAGIGQA